MIITILMMIALLILVLYIAKESFCITEEGEEPLKQALREIEYFRYATQVTIFFFIVITAVVLTNY